jgi:transcriptional regulator with PAS, ATPase and Fis domain
MENLPSDLYYNYLESINIGVFILDAAGNYVYTNEAYRNVGENSLQFFENMSVRQLMEMEYIRSSTWELVLKRKDTVSTIISVTDKKLQKVYDALSTGIPFFDSSGQVSYIFVIQETLAHLNDRIYQGSANAYATLSHLDQINTAPVNLIAESPKMKQLVTLLDTISNADVPVLISGASGSGKEVVANYIHTTSARNSKPFLALNCAVIPENLMESELFGYEKGAFSGASASGKKGLIEAADGGTLFLDEINSMPLSLQAKLLRVLETKQVTRVGSVTSKSIDFRLVCASNEDLNQLIKEKRFRADLYYRINVISVHIPPLRERPEDILALSLHFVQYYCKKYQCTKIISKAVLSEFLAYDWPGNVRELKNTIERMVITSPYMELERENIPESILSRSAPEESMEISFDEFFESPENRLLTGGRVIHFNEDFSLEEYMNRCEKEVLELALKKFKTPASVADILKLDLSNVYRKMHKHGIKR